MKLLLASDLHGSVTYTRRLLAIAEQIDPDLLVLLGDVYYHGPRNPLPEGYAPKEVAALLNAVKDRLLVIRGNCDSEVDQMISEFHFVESAALFIGGKTLYLSHGHVFDPDHLPAIPAGSAFAYGHTHRILDRIESGVHVLNPGSLSLPTAGHRAYILIEDTSVRTFSLDGTLLSQSIL